MRKKHFILFIYIFFLSVTATFAQKEFTLSGTVMDSASHENLAGVTVMINPIEKGVVTNIAGQYSFTLPEGNYEIKVTFVGYKEITRKVNLNKDTKVNFALPTKYIVTNEIVIKGKKDDANVQSTEMGKVSIPIDKLNYLPVLFGEKDIIKTLQLMPGIQAAGEGNSGFYVRGGGPDQNLILLDGTTVYNASHLFGFFSVFNSDMIKTAELTKGGMPANYGGRLASVLDIETKIGDDKKYTGSGGIGVIASNLTVEGPIVKEKASFIFSARRTYIDVLIKPFMSPSSPFKGTGYYFYDLNGKLSWRISSKDRLSLSGYHGRDVFDFNNKNEKANTEINWGNSTAALTWDHIFNDKFTVKTAAHYTGYEFNIGSQQPLFSMQMSSNIKDWSGTTDFTYIPSQKHTIKFGAIYTHHRFLPTAMSGATDTVDFTIVAPYEYTAHEIGAYALHDWDINKHWKVNYGLRYSNFDLIGPATRYLVDGYGYAYDSITYGKGEIIKAYNHIEPRINLRYAINDNNSIKLSFTSNYQYLQLAAMSSMSLPTDTWFPSTDLIKPQHSTQYAIGYFWNFLDNMFESSLEAYYKSMNNLIEFKEGVDLGAASQTNLDYSFTSGKGESYGAELFIKKRMGSFSGWLGYTLSWTTRTFPEINQGKQFYAKYDRRHDVSLVLMYEWGERWKFSLVWVYASGNGMTIPISLYFINNRIISEYSERNAYRMPPYHRMDISATYTFKKKKRIENSLNFSIYNLYNRYNPYYIYFSQEGDINAGSLNIIAKQVSIFPILPSVTWNFKF